MNDCVVDRRRELRDDDTISVCDCWRGGDDEADRRPVGEGHGSDDEGCDALSHHEINIIISSLFQGGRQDRPDTTVTLPMHTCLGYLSPNPSPEPVKPTGRVGYRSLSRANFYGQARRRGNGAHVSLDVVAPTNWFWERP
jgi:hypothetical protein